MEAKAFLKELVSRESISGNETEASAFLVDSMRELGYRKAYVDEVGNAIGFWGNPSGRCFMLVGHIDTVPGWIKPGFEQTSKEHHTGHSEGSEILYGRGVVDAKGPLATFVQAVSRLSPDVEDQFIVVGAVEEEAASSKGAHQLLQDFAEPVAVIIGEPSNTNGVTLGYKGRLLCDFSIKREMSHSAGPGLSAGDVAFELHRKILEYIQGVNSDKQGLFYTLDCTIRSLKTKSDGFVEKGDLRLGFRLGPDFEPMAVKQQLSNFTQLLNEQSQGESTIGVRFWGDERAAQFDKGTNLARILRVAVRKSGLNPRMLLKTGTSDMNVLRGKWSCPMVAYGPGDSALDHTPQERMNVEDYRLAIEILADALKTLSESK